MLAKELDDVHILIDEPCVSITPEGHYKNHARKHELATTGLFHRVCLYLKG